MATSKLKAREPEEVQPGHSKMIIFGPSGVGKTWFGLSFPKPYYMDTEGGADLKHYQARLKAAGGGYLGPSDGTLEFDFILDQITALSTEKHGFKTLVIDSITKVFQTAIAREAERLLVTGKKNEFSADKKPAVAAMRRLIAAIDRLDMNVVLIAQEASEWSTDKSGQSSEVGKKPDVWDKTIYELDLAIHCQRRGPERVGIVKKTRLTGFPEGESFMLDYATFADRYGKDFIEAEPTPIVLISPQAIAEINELLEVVKVEEGLIEKFLTRAKATTLEELNQEQGVKIIDFLRKKLPQPSTK